MNWLVATWGFMAGTWFLIGFTWFYLIQTRKRIKFLASVVSSIMFAEIHDQIERVLKEESPVDQQAQD
jgi:hypothetical protein